MQELSQRQSGEKRPDRAVIVPVFYAGRLNYSMTTYARTKRWRAKHPEVKAAERLRYYRQFQKNDKRKGKRWTEAEDKKITARNAPADSKLSARLGRSVQAIQQRRSALKAQTFRGLEVSR